MQCAQSNLDHNLITKFIVKDNKTTHNSALVRLNAYFSLLAC